MNARQLSLLMNLYRVLIVVLTLGGLLIANRIRGFLQSRVAFR